MEVYATANSFWNPHDQKGKHATFQMVSDDSKEIFIVMLYIEPRAKFVLILL